MLKKTINDNIVIITKVVLNMILKGKGGGYAVAGRCLNKRIRLNVVNNVSNNKLTYMPYYCGVLRDNIFRKVKQKNTDLKYSFKTIRKKL